MTDGPVYRDIDNPNSALFHIHVENLDRAMCGGSAQTRSRNETKRAAVVGRDFYLGREAATSPSQQQAGRDGTIRKGR